MIAGLRKCVGSSIIVDYRTNSGMLAYAKGTLKEIIEEPVMLVVENGDGTVWYISLASVMSFKVGGV